MTLEIIRLADYRKYRPLIILAAILLLCFNCPCQAAESDSKETEKKNKSSENSIVITPAPSISSNSPAFQTSLTKLIRTKGHADQANKKGDLKKAKKLYLRCVKDPKVNHQALGYCYKSLALIYDNEGNKKDAKKYYKLAIQEMTKHKKKRQVELLQKKLLNLNNSKQSN